MITFNKPYIKSYIAYFENEDYKSLSSPSGLTYENGTAIPLSECLFDKNSLSENGAVTIKTPTNTEDIL
jgi:hypothetical protein